MTPERLRQIETLFHAALARAPEDRAAFLRDACEGDEALRNEVVSLIHSSEQTGDFIEQPAFERGLHFLTTRPLYSLLGRQIGPYQILSLVGTGGMGEVYVALDTRLNRKVAIKSLHRSEISSPEHERRFWHEARAASAIIHPNVAQIYEVIEVEEFHCLVMEYVDGDTLRQRFGEGVRPLPFILNTACQIAAALIAAHQAGVIHRDIKPENVILLADDHVKVLDFGLAKRIEVPSAADERWKKVIHTSIRTTPGLILGTIPYMSPEQARGLTVDVRTDLWSLGVVIYEMVTQHVPFKGDTTSDTIAAILERQPTPLVEFSEEVPHELQAIVDKALAKDVGSRYLTAQEMHTDLRALSEDVAFEAKRHLTPRRGSSRIAPVTSPVEPASGSRAKPLIVASLVLILVCGLIWWFFLRTSPEHFALGQLEVKNFSESGDVLEAAIAPDGKFVVFLIDEDGKQSFWLKQVATADKIPLAQPVHGFYRGITISRDGNYMFYCLFRDAPQGELYRVSIPAATDARKLLDDVDPPISLSPDGKRLAFIRQNQSRPNELVLADAATGEAQSLLSDSRLAPGGVSWSTREDIIACSVRVKGDDQEYWSVAGFSIRNGEPINLTSHRWRKIDRIVWLDDMSGLLLLAADEKSQLMQIWHLSYPSGVARRLTNDIGEYRTLSRTTDSSVLATVHSIRLSRIWVSRLANPPPQAIALTSGRDEGFYGLTWTPDGRIVYTSTASGNRELWVINKDGSGQRRLTSGGRSDRHPVVTPDSRYVLFVSDRDGNSKVWRIGLDGSGLVALTQGPDDSFPSISPDGQSVTYAARVEQRRGLWRVPVAGGSPTRVTSFLSNSPAISPNGQYIACLFRDDPGTAEVRLAIVPFAGGNPLRTLDLPHSLAVGPDLSFSGFRWSADSLSVLYVRTADGVSNIWSQSIAGGSPKQVTNFTSDRIFWFDFSALDNSLAYTRGQYTHDVVLISDSQSGPR